MTRRRIIAAAQAHQKDGAIPPTVDRPELARNARGGSFVCSDKVDWLDAYAEELRKAQSPAGFLLQAAE
jgi:phthalate 4,5-dioxygenase